MHSLTCMHHFMVIQMGVDKTRREKLRVTVNVTFPALPCQGESAPHCLHVNPSGCCFTKRKHCSSPRAVLSFDAVDMAGKHDTDVVKGGDIEIHKYRLDRFGAHVEHDEYVPPAVVQIVETPFGMQLNGQAKEVRILLMHCCAIAA